MAAFEDGLIVQHEDGRPPPAPEDRYLGYLCLDVEVWFVRWGELEFAVPGWAMEHFCAAASDGVTFPGLPFRVRGVDAEPGHRAGPEPARPPGAPDVPGPYRHLLRTEPVECALVELVDWRPRAGQDGVYEAVYATDAGVGAALVPGLRLWVESDDEPLSGRVEIVEPGFAHVRFTVGRYRTFEARHLAGARASTRRPPPGDEATDPVRRAVDDLRAASTREPGGRGR